MIDAWTTPNNNMFVVFTVHIEHEGHSLSFLLNIVKVPESHMGEQLAKELQQVLEAFKIEEKVSGV